MREADKQPLPDRFVMAMRAIRGEFSPAEGAADNERTEDALTAALLSFPAKVTLRVVTRCLGGFEPASDRWLSFSHGAHSIPAARRPIDDAEAERFASELAALVGSVSDAGEVSEAFDATLKVRARWIGFHAGIEHD